MEVKTLKPYYIDGSCRLVVSLVPLWAILRCHIKSRDVNYNNEHHSLILILHCWVTVHKLMFPSGMRETPFVSICYSDLSDDFDSCRTVNPQEHNLPAVLLQDIKRLIFGQNTGFLDVQSVSSKAIFMISTNIGVERAFQRTILQSDLQPSHGFNFIAILFRMQKAGKVAHPLTHCILFVIRLRAKDALVGWESPKTT